MSGTPAQDATLTGISVAYNQSLKPATVKMSKKARVKARQELKGDGLPTPFGMSPKRKKVRPSDPAQNNPNNYNIIIPQGQGPL